MKSEPKSSDVVQSSSPGVEVAQKNTPLPATDKSSMIQALRPQIPAIHALLVYVTTWAAQLIVVTPVFLLVAFLYLGELDLANEDIPDLPIAANMIVYAVSVIASLAVVLIYMKIAKISLRSIGLRIPAFKYILLAFPALVVYFFLTAILGVGLEAIAPQELLEEDQVTGFEDASGILDLGLAFVALVIVAPISEEILYRGFLFKSWSEQLVRGVTFGVTLVTTYFVISQLGQFGQNNYDFTTTALISLGVSVPLLLVPDRFYQKLPRWGRAVIAGLLISMLFGVAHAQLNVAVDTFALSIVMIAMTYLSRSIVPAILIHMAKNGIAYYFIFINPSLLDTL